MDTREKEDTKERFKNERRDEWSHCTIHGGRFFFSLSLIHSHPLCHQGTETGDGMQTREGGFASPLTCPPHKKKSSTGYRCIIQTLRVSCCCDNPTPTFPRRGLTSHVKRCLFKVTLNKSVASLNCHHVDPSFLLCYAKQPKHADFSLPQHATWPRFGPQNRVLRE